MLRTELPRIITEELPGPKAKKIIEKALKTIRGIFCLLVSIMIQKTRNTAVKSKHL